MDDLIPFKEELGNFIDYKGYLHSKYGKDMFDKLIEDRYNNISYFE